MEINTLKTGRLVGCVYMFILYVLHVAMQQDPFARHIVVIISLLEKIWVGFLFLGRLEPLHRPAVVFTRKA